MLSVTILVISASLFLFYLQAACERILRRPFEDPLPDPIVDANRLEFPFIRRALEEYDAPVDYARFRVQLMCDYLALIYLLRNAANHHRRLSGEERTLAVYFRALSGLLALCHLSGLTERPLLLKMTSVLEYFANVLGERIKRVRFGHLTASEYLMSL
ncbi:MAG TPA: hypothetical protein VG860_04130 [Terriglobia bacterium]|jgi:hypothetical protein|nr:hypothetical protein [Terriglobia bacterium]